MSYLAVPGPTASQVLAPVGSVAAPPISFAAAPSVGLYTTVGNIYFCTAGDYPAYCGVGVFGFQSTTVVTHGEVAFQANIDAGYWDQRANNTPTNPTGHRIYNTFTSSTNYERCSMTWGLVANVFAIAAEKGSGGGTARPISVRFDGTERMRFDATGIGVFASAPVAKQTSGADLTNNVTVGGTTDTIADFSDLTVYANSAAAIRNNLYQLARKVKQVNDALRLYGWLT